MCFKRMIQYAKCGHFSHAEILKCAAACKRPNQTPCVPASGHQRDLPQTIDVQDRNQPGSCPACMVMTPPSSAGSQG